MIRYCTGTTWIGSKTIYIGVHVEIQNENDIEEADTIANEVLKTSNAFGECFDGLDSEYFEDVKVSGDDTYDDKNIEEMLNHTDLSVFNKSFKTLYKSFNFYKYNNKEYKVLINIFREK